MTCLVLAAQIIGDKNARQDDTILVAYRLLHPEMEILKHGYFMEAFRHTINNTILIIMRFLKFRLNFEHPHQHVAVLLTMLSDWYPEEFRQHSGILNTAAVVLQDLYSCPKIIMDHKPLTLATMVISIAINAHGANINDKNWIPTLYSFRSERFQRLKHKTLLEIYG